MSLYGYIPYTIVVELVNGISYCLTMQPLGVASLSNREFLLSSARFWGCRKSEMDSNLQPLSVQPLVYEWLYPSTIRLPSKVTFCLDLPRFAYFP